MRLRFYDFAFVSLIGTTILVYLLGQANLATVSLYFFGSAIVPLAALYMLKRWRGQERTKQLTVFSLFLGFFLWLLAEIIWATYVFVLKIEPHPSLADGFWIAGYCFMGVTFYSILKWTKYTEKIKLRLLNIAVSFGLGTLVLLTVIMPMIANIRAVTLVSVIDLSYPMFDVLLFSAAFGALLALIRTDLWSTWVLIPSGFILYLIGDIGFAMLTVNNIHLGYIIEIFWIIGNLSVAFGCLRVGMRSSVFGKFLETKTLTVPEGSSEKQSFTRNLGVDVKGNVVLMDFDPTSHYEKSIKWFLTEFSPAIIFTRKSSALYDMTKKTGQKLVVLSEQISVPKMASENEVWVPPRRLSLILNALNQTLEANRNADGASLGIVFDNLTDITLLIGFEKTYVFLRNALDMLQTENVTAIFLLNTEVHPKEHTSAFRGIFNSQISFKNEKLHHIKMLKNDSEKDAAGPQDAIEAHTVQ